MHHTHPGAKYALHLIRQHRKVLLHQIATRAGCTLSAVSRWDCGESEPAPPYRKAYAEALGLGVGELGRLVYEESIKGSPQPVVRKQVKRSKRKGRK